MKTKLFFSAAAILLLGACSHYSEDLASLESKMSASPAVMAAAPQDIAPAAGAMSATAIYKDTLAREFYTMAKSEQEDAYDYKAAKRYTEKVMKAKEGKAVLPSKLSAFDIPAERRAPLEQARADLMAALETKNTAENAQNLAIAQCRYECWLERAEEALDETHYAQCRNDFETAMAQLIAPAAGVYGAPAENFDLRFAANSAVMDEASQKLLAHVANVMNAPENAGRTAMISGYMGGIQGEYANTIAAARINAVKTALIERGVNAARLNPAISPDAGEAKVQVILSAPAAAAILPATPASMPAAVQ